MHTQGSNIIYSHTFCSSTLGRGELMTALVKQVTLFSIYTAVDIADRRGLSCEAHHELLPKKTKIKQY